EGVRALVHRAEERLRLLVEQREGPAAALEAVAAVLVRAAEALHHPVERDVGDGRELHDRGSVRSGRPRWAASHPLPRTPAAGFDTRPPGLSRPPAERMRIVDHLSEKRG